MYLKKSCNLSVIIQILRKWINLTSRRSEKNQVSYNQSRTGMPAAAPRWHRYDHEAGPVQAIMDLTSTTVVLNPDSDLEFIKFQTFLFS